MDNAKNNLRELKLLLEQIQENDDGETYQEYLYKIEAIIDELPNHTSANIEDILEESLSHLRNFNNSYITLLKKVERIKEQIQENDKV